MSELGPILPADRLARRREHLMHEIQTQAVSHPSPAQRRTPSRRASVVAGLALGVVVLTGGAAFAGHALGIGPIWRQADGSVAIGATRPAYQGGYLSEDQLRDLQDRGKAMAGVNNQELACQGITLYFDTETDANGYMADFDARDAGYKASDADQDSGDPCAPYVNAPRYVTDK